MRTNPGRRARRFRRHGHRQPTRMTEYQRGQQALLDRHDGMRCHLGLIDDAAVDDVDVEDSSTEQDPAADTAAVDTDDSSHYRPAGELREVTAYERAILGALQNKPVYPKSVHPDVIQARRRRDRAARRARRANRAAVALLMAVMMGFGAALYYSVPAHALAAVRQVTVTIGWSTSRCVQLVEPSGWERTRLVDTVTCKREQGQSITYLTRPGEWYGVKMVAPGAGLACEVRIGNEVVATQNALDTVDCLGRW